MEDQKQPGTELVVATPASQFKPISALPLVASDIHQRPAVYSTITPDTPERSLQLYDMMVSGGDNAALWVNRTFEVQDILVHPVVKTNRQTGEVTPLPRIVIWTTDGDVIQFASSGVWNSILMMMVCGFRPFGKISQPMTLIQQDLGEGRKMYRLDRCKDNGQGDKINSHGKKK